MTQARKGAAFPGRPSFAGARWVLSVILLAALVSGCGFHLRGAYELPSALHITHVDAANPNSELVRSLKRALRANELRLVDDPVQATAVLRISGETRNRRVLSVDSRGRAREYELQYSVSFEVTARDNSFTLASQTLGLQREFLFDPEDVLGKSSEEDVLLQEMQQDMVRLILLRIQAAVREAPASEPASGEESR